MGAGKGGDGGDGEAAAAAAPEPVVLKMDLHCAGCAGKVRKAIKRVPGVVSTVTDVAANRVVVAGTADAGALKARLEAKTGKAVEIVSDGGAPKKPAAAAEPKQDAGEKKGDKGASPKEEEKEKKQQAEEEKKPKQVGTRLAMPATQSFSWNSELINQIFEPQAVQAIQDIITVPSTENDTVKWRHSTKGECSTKDAFRYLNNQMQASLPSQGARSISQGALYILQRTWKHKTISPNVKTFVWRLVRRALATGERAGNLSAKINKNCYHCGLIENDSHIFFHCNFARAVWFSSRPPLRTSSLPQEHDGVQVALEILITHSTSDEDMQQILTTLWFIWRARNDLRFRQRHWSVLQVHFATQAHINTFRLTSDRDRGHKGDATNTPQSSQVRSLCRAGDHQQVRQQARGDQSGGHQNLFILGLPNNQRLCRYPMLLPGARCYTDASIAPDTQDSRPRKAGIGVFILHPGCNIKLYIKAQISNITSVVMAEAAAMALAATIISWLQVDFISFLTDNLLLVDFFNGADFENPPHWEAKPFTQGFLNSTANKKVQETVLLKIRLHCDGCADRIRRRIYKIKGVKDVVLDGKDEVKVTGTMDIPNMLSYLKEKLNRDVEAVAPPAKKDGGGEGKDEKKDSGSGDKNKGLAEDGAGGDDKKDKGKGIDVSAGPSTAAAAAFMAAPAGASTYHVAPPYGYVAYQQPPPPPASYYPYPSYYGNGDGMGHAANPAYYHQPQQQQPDGHQQPQVAYPPYRFDMAPAPQLFSDENPNACSVM